MKKYPALAVLLAALFVVPSAWAQEDHPLCGQSINGSTGLFSIPSGRIGWERLNGFGLDLGYRAVMNKSGTAHIPAITMSLFKWVEVSSAFDIQPAIKFAGEEQKNNDLIFGAKLRMPTNVSNPKNPAIALGVSGQFLNLNNKDYQYNVFQPYAAISYGGTFFNMTAETTVVFGKTLLAGGPNNTDFDFGMGFDIILFPDVLQNTVHWIIDFANFDYSHNSWPNNVYAGSGPATYRGIVNTGLRIDLGSFPALSEIKLMLDFVFNDLFDYENRSFTIGAAFGFPILNK